VTAHHPPIIASVGLPFVIAEVSAVETLGRMRSNLAAFGAARERFRRPEERFSLFIYARSRTASAACARACSRR
jgi:trans-2,3-dihydro-3-hydroxyanthranilate isomerase